MAVISKPAQRASDPYRDAASKVFGVPPSEVTEEQRRYAKGVRYGLIYGMSGPLLARNFNG